MEAIESTSRLPRLALRALPSRRVGLTAAALLFAAGGLSAGWVSLGTQQRKWIFQASQAPTALAKACAPFACSVMNSRVRDVIACVIFASSTENVPSGATVTAPASRK